MFLAVVLVEHVKRALHKGLSIQEVSPKIKYAQHEVLQTRHPGVTGLCWSEKLVESIDNICISTTRLTEILLLDTSNKNTIHLHIGRHFYCSTSTQLCETLWLAGHLAKVKLHCSTRQNPLWGLATNCADKNTHALPGNNLMY